MATRRIKCRFCDYTTSVLIRSGSIKSGFDRLSDHVQDAHPAESYELLLRIIDEEEKLEFLVKSLYKGGMT